MAGTQNHISTYEEQLQRERLNDDLFTILEDHLHGVGRGILRARLEYLCNDAGKNALTLYNEAQISKNNAIKLTTLLCCSEKIKEPDTLFGWIKTLSQKDYGHRHLEDFYHLVKEVKPRKSYALPLFLTTLGTALGGFFLALMPEKMRVLERIIANTLPIAASFLQVTFSVLKNIPLVVLMYDIACIPYHAFHSIHHNALRTLPKRIQKGIADTLPPIFSLISYALCYGAQGVFTPAAVGFFIASSLVGVVNSFVNLNQLKPLDKKPAKSAPLEEKLDYIRQKERRARTTQTVFINLVSSVLISITAILWGLFPPSFVVMLGSIAFISLVGFTKSATLTRIHIKGSETLQKELDKASHGNKKTTKEAIEAKEKAFETSMIQEFEKLHEKLDISLKKAGMLEKELAEVKTAAAAQQVAQPSEKPANQGDIRNYFRFFRKPPESVNATSAVDSKVTNHV